MKRSSPFPNVRPPRPPGSLARIELRRRSGPSWLSLGLSLMFHAMVLAAAAYWLGGSGGAAGEQGAAQGSPADVAPAIAVKIATRTAHTSARTAPASSTLAPRSPVLVASTESSSVVLPAPSMAADLPAATWTPTPSLALASAAPASAEPSTRREEHAGGASARKRPGGRSGAGEGSGSGSGIGKGSATAPRPLATRVPAYPWSARKSGIEGVVLVRVQVSESGRVQASSVYRSSGNDDLDAAAVACVAKWSFSPGQSSGRPVAAAAVVRVSFRLES